jgi:LEA14-like dessication related protein
MKHILLFSSLALILGSCATLQKVFLKEPTVEYRTVQVQGLDFERVSLLLDFAVTNPNALDLNASAYRWNVSIGGKEFVTGTSPAPLTVAGKSTSVVQIPVSIGFNDLFDVFGDLAANDSVPYVVNLSTDLEIPVLGTRSIPVSSKGYVPVPKLPTFRIDDFELTKFSLAGSVVTLKMRVANPNYFAVTYSNATYALKVNGEEWLNSRLNRSIEIMPKSDVVLSIPIDVNLQRWGTTVYRILTRGEEFSYALNGKGDLSVGLPDFPELMGIPFSVTGKQRIEQP